MTQFAVLHIEKNKGGQAGLSKHIGRENIPANADKEKTHLNQIIVGSQNQLQDIEQRIGSAVKQTTAIRKDAVRAMQVILTGSHELMKELEAQGKMKAWTDKNQSWLNRTFGKENVVNLTLHMDEKTPHFHATVTPITADGRLCAKEFMQKIKLKEYQTSYALEMQPFGFSRGLEESRAEHQTTAQFYKNINQEEKPTFERGNILESKEKMLERFLKEHHKPLQKKIKDYELKAKRVEELTVLAISRKKDIDVLKAMIAMTAEGKISTEELKKWAIDSRIIQENKPKISPNLNNQVNKLHVPDLNKINQNKKGMEL